MSERIKPSEWVELGEHRVSETWDELMRVEAVDSDDPGVEMWRERAERAEEWSRINERVARDLSAKGGRMDMRVGKDQEVLCPLPGCDEALYVEHTSSVQVFADPESEHYRAEDGWSLSWQVTCVQGHVIATSHDGGNDWDDPEPPRVDWLHERIARLAAIREDA